MPVLDDQHAAPPHKTQGQWTDADLTPVEDAKPVKTQGQWTDADLEPIEPEPPTPAAQPTPQPGLLGTVREFFKGDYLKDLTPPTAALAKRQTPELARAGTGLIGAVRELHANGLTDAALDQASDALEAAARGSTPLAILALPATPVKTVLSVAAAWGAGSSAGKLDALMGGTPSQQRFARAFIGMATAGLLGTKIARDIAGAAGKAAVETAGPPVRSAVLAAQLAGRQMPSGTAEALAPSVRPSPSGVTQVVEQAGAPTNVAPEVGETLGELVHTVRAPEPPPLHQAPSAYETLVAKLPDERLADLAQAPNAEISLVAKQEQARRAALTPNAPVATVQPAPEGSTGAFVTVPPAPDLVAPGEEAAYNEDRRVMNTGPLGGVEERRKLPAEQVAEDYRANPVEAKAKADEMRRKADEARALVKEPEEAPAREYASTQVNLPPETSQAVTKLSGMIPDEDLAEKGREDAPHITVKFGLHDSDPETVRKIIEAEPPITATLGKTSFFPADPNNGNSDVLKVDVTSPDLTRLNEKIAEAVKTTDTHPEYTPHVTIAYLKPGKGKDYDGDTSLAGQKITFDSLVFSGADGKETEIPLKGKVAVPPAKPQPQTKPGITPPPRQYDRDAAQATFKKFKTSLTRVVNASRVEGQSKDDLVTALKAVVAEAERFNDYYERSAEPFPDDWNRWKREGEDAEYDLKRVEGGLDVPGRNYKPNVGGKKPAAPPPAKVAESKPEAKPPAKVAYEPNPLSEVEDKEYVGLLSKQKKKTKLTDEDTAKLKGYVSRASEAAYLNHLLTSSDISLQNTFVSNQSITNKSRQAGLPVVERNAAQILYAMKQRGLEPDHEQVEAHLHDVDTDELRAISRDKEVVPDVRADAKAELNRRAKEKATGDKPWDGDDDVAAYKTWLKEKDDSTRWALDEERNLLEAAELTFRTYPDYLHNPELVSTATLEDHLKGIEDVLDDPNKADLTDDDIEMVTALKSLLDRELLVRSGQKGLFEPAQELPAEAEGRKVGEVTEDAGQPPAVAATEEAPEERPVASREEGAARPERPRSERPRPPREPAGAEPVAERDESKPSAGAGTGRPVSERPRPVPGGRGVRAAAVGKDTAGLTPDLYHITDADNIGTGTSRERVSRNMAAIRILRQLTAEDRRATPEEQSALVKYVGWGGLPRIFEYWKHFEDDEANSANDNWWYEQGRALTALMTETEYATARNSTQNAHYTSPTVIKAMWDAVQQLGVTNGSMLEPAAGIGHFIGLMPNELRGWLAVATVEKDAVSAAITAALYPGAYNQHSGFEDATLPDNHFTVSISNVPFGLIPITDKAWAGPAFVPRRIHNYFFGKALTKVAPGGLVAFITSHGTLDAGDETGQRVREYLASQADFLGAIRLPFTAFKGNAGTEVVTDLIFLRKRFQNEKPAHVAPWLESKKIDLPAKNGDNIAQRSNEYMLDHPEMVLGTPTSTGKMRGQAEHHTAGGQHYNVEPNKDVPFEQQLAEAIKRLPMNAINTKPPAESLEAFEAAQAPVGSRPFEYVVVDGTLAQNIDGRAVPVDVTKTDEARIRGMLPIREAIRKLYDLMAEDADDDVIRAAQKELNQVYDKFVKRHGPISSPENWEAMYEDPDIPILLSLEDYDEEKGTAAKTAVFSQRTKRAERKARTASTPESALTITLGEVGKIMLDRIGELLGKGPDEAAGLLQDAGLIIDTPSGWQLPTTYLSGNVRVKLAEATAAAQLDPRYQGAVDRLTPVIPEDRPAYRIKVRLGVSWVPVEMVQQFVASIVSGNASEWTTAYSAPDAKWDISGSPGAHSSKFATPDVDTKTLLLDAMNDRRRVIKSEIKDPMTGNTRRVVDKQATALARQRKDDLNNAFADWLLKDDKARSEWAVRTYNDLYHSYVEPKVDGSYLTFPGMADWWRDRITPHQRDAIARILQFGNTLLAHVVGAGKTLEMVGAIMEMKRNGLARKPMMVVPNHLISQVPSEFLQHYPSAKILVMKSSDLDAERRKRFTARIASGDYDAIIVPYSAFVRISMSAEAESKYQKELLDQIELALIKAWKDAEDAESDKGGNRGRKKQRGSGKKTPPSVKNLENMRDKVKGRLEHLAERPKDDVLTFEQIGVDALFVDEAHSFKNLYFPTRQQAAGIPSNNDAQRALDLYLKSRYINQLSGNRNLVLATGTPVSNSMAEVFVMQKLLQEQALDRAGIGSFDAWLAQFGQIVAETTLDPSGTGMSARPVLKKFKNLVDLASMFRQVADVKMIDDLPDLKAKRPKLKDGKIEQIVVPVTPGQLLLLNELKERAKNLNPKDRKSDNMPMITGDGRMGMLDMRLLDRRTKEEKGNKISKVAEHVIDIWKENKAKKGTQLVFLDAGTPGSDKRSNRPRKEVNPQTGEVTMRPPTERELNRGYDLYADLKKKLVKGGIPIEQIAVIHDIDSVPEKKQDAARKALFRKMREGTIRVLIGSTGKMGTGMNVQDRLVALHNVDPAWKPSDIEQRNGRILRQGNLFAKEDPDFRIRILNYITSGKGQAFGFDAYMWQLNERKAGIIADFFSGDLQDKDYDLDLNQTVFTASEMKAVATGNPKVIEFGKLQGELERLELVKQGYEQSKREASFQVGVWKDIAAREELANERWKKTAAAVTPEPEDTKPVFHFGGVRALENKLDESTIEGQEAIGDALVEAAKKLVTPTKSHPGPWKSYVEPKFIGTYRGLSLTIEGNGTTDPWIVLRHPDDKPPRYNEKRPDTEYQSIRLEMLKPDTEGPGGHNWRTGKGLMQSVRHEVDHLLSRQSDYLQHARERVREYQNILSQPYAQQKELSDMRLRVEELAKELDIPLEGMGTEAVQEMDTDEGGGDGETIPKKGGGTTLEVTLVPGARQIGEVLERELGPIVEPMLQGLKGVVNEAKNKISPQTASPEAQRIADVVRHAKAKFNNAATIERLKYTEGVVDKLQRWATSGSLSPIKAAIQQFEKNTDDENIAAISEYERTGRFPGEPQYSELYQSSMDLARALLEHAYGEIGYIENYVRRMFKFGSDADAEKGTQYLQNRQRTLSANRSPTKGRVLLMPLDEALADMRDRGIKVVPATTNPEELREWSLANAHRAAAYADAWNYARDMKFVTWVPMGTKPPRDMTSISERGAWAFYPSERGLGQYYAQPDIARILNNATSKGMEDSASFRAARFVNGQLNQMQLGLSAFHLTFTAVSSGLVDASNGIRRVATALRHADAAMAGSGAVALARAPFFPVSFGRNMLIGAKLVNGLKNNSPMAYAFLREKLNPAGARLQMERRFMSSAMANMKRAWKTGAHLKAGLWLPWSVVEVAAMPLMQYAIPRIKLGVLYDRIADIDAMHPDYTDVEKHRAYAAASDQIDNIFGLLVYDNGFWDKTYQDLAQVTTRSVGWTGGSLRWFLGAAGDIGRAAKDAAALVGGGGGGGGGTKEPPPGGTGTGEDDEPRRRRPFFTDRVLDASVLPLFVGLLGAVYMYAHTHRWPQKAIDYFHPENGRQDTNGRASRTNLPTYMKDVEAYRQALGDTYDSGTPLPIIQTFAKKAAPAPEEFWSWMRNRNYFDNMIWNPDDTRSQKLHDFGLYVANETLPFSVQQSLQASQEAGGKEAKIEAFFGFTKAGRSVTDTPLEAYLHRLDLLKHVPETPEQQERFRLRRQLREGKAAKTEEGADAASEAVASGELSRTQQREARKAAVSRQTYVQDKFKQLSLDEAFQAYELASAEQRVDLRGLLRRKQFNALKNGTIAPNDKREFQERYQRLMGLPIGTEKETDTHGPT